MRISTDITALNGESRLEDTGATLASSLEKLSSVYRINRAADDASGLVISQSLESQLSGLRRATRNTVLDSTLANLEVSSQNLTASESHRADIAVSLDLVAFTRNQILLQADAAMLAHANDVPRTILDLLR